MDKRQFALLAAALRTYYPRENLLPNMEALDLWYEKLQDLDYAQVNAGVARWVSTNRYSPTISDIRSFSMKATHGELPDWGASWNTMKRMISKWGYMREDKALEEMDPITREVVMRLGFQSICQSEDEEVLRGQFRRIHEDVSRMASEDAQVPDKLKILASATEPQLDEPDVTKPTLVKEEKSPAVSDEWRAKIAAIRERKDA